MIYIKKAAIFLVSLTMLAGCGRLLKIDEALPDKRTTYQKSIDLPALEIPPDLIMTTGENQAIIPDEAESTTLREFELQREQRERRDSVVLGSGEAVDEKWLALKGDLSDIWSKLRQFWEDNGYIIDLNDMELGVLETNWKKSDISRNKFQLFAENDETGGVIIFLSSARQELSEGLWIDATADKELEKETLRRLNLYFYSQSLN